MRVALYGGSFNPPHVGHVLAVAYLTTIAGFERVIVVPVYEHAFEKSLLRYQTRVELCERAFALLKQVEVSTIECELPAPSYTISTVEALLSRHPDWRLELAVGADVLSEIDRWHRAPELKKLAPLYVMGRYGYESFVSSAPLLPEVSSTELRALLRGPLTPESEGKLRRLLPHSVLEFILANGLYR
jgi:nicotinate-nucleotide adenylyltransferase